MPTGKIDPVRTCRKCGGPVTVASKTSICYPCLRAHWNEERHSVTAVMVVSEWSRDEHGMYRTVTGA